MSGFKLPPILCINIKSRKDRKKNIKKQCKKLGIPFEKIQFYNPVPNKENPVLGCLESHVSCINIAKEKDWEEVLIIEDDVDFKKTLKDVPAVPEDAKIAYLGYNINNWNPNQKLKETGSYQWLHIGQAFTTHCYIIKKELYDIILEEVNNHKDEAIDKIYLKYIQPKYKCVGIYPQIAGQLKGYSDIEKKYIDYDYLFVKIIQQCDFEMENGKIKLSYKELEQYPPVSIITPTRNRSLFMKLAYINFNTLGSNYPGKVEWIIVDDSDVDQPKLEDVVPYDERISLVSLNPLKEEGGKYTIAKKRNIGVKYASFDIIAHMDDDDFYFPDYLKIAVNILEKEQCGLVGSTTVNCYNVVKDNFFMTGHSNAISEATMVYRKSFWEKRQFNEYTSFDEQEYFISKRFHEIISIPSMFSIIAITHGNNITENLREGYDTNGVSLKEYFYDKFYEELLNIKNKIIYDV